MPLSQVLHKNQVLQKTLHYQVCKEFYSINPIVIYFPKNSYLVESINSRLEAFSSNGLIKYWASNHMNMKYLNLKWNNTGPKQLSLENISGILQILFTGLVMSTVVFLGEVFLFRFKF